MAILSKAHKPDNFESRNSLNLVLWVLKVFVQISLDETLSLNQTHDIRIYVYVRQTWMIRFIISLLGLIWKHIILM